MVINHTNVSHDKGRIKHSLPRKKKWCDSCKSATHDTKTVQKDTAKLAAEFISHESTSPDTYAFKVSECQSICQDSLLVDCGAMAHIITENAKFTHSDGRRRSRASPVLTDIGLAYGKPVYLLSLIHISEPTRPY